MLPSLFTTGRAFSLCSHRMSFASLSVRPSRAKTSLSMGVMKSRTGAEASMRLTR